MNFEVVDWRESPEIARSMYCAFPHRIKSDLRGYGRGPESMWVAGRMQKNLCCALNVHIHGYDGYTYVGWLWTPKKFRTQGYATTMLNCAQSWFGPLFVHCGEYNQNALAFYKKRGFKEDRAGSFMSYHGKILLLYRD